MIRETSLHSFLRLDAKTEAFRRKFVELFFRILIKIYTLRQNLSIDFSNPCQTNLEMSAFYQDRNVRFS